MQSPCQKGNAHQCDPGFVREALGAAAAALNLPASSLECGEHLVNVGGLVEIRAILFDCSGLLAQPYWVVRRISDLSSARPCACGARIQEGEIGSYRTFPEATAVAIGEFVRMAIIKGCQQSEAGDTNPSIKPKPCCEAGGQYQPPTLMPDCDSTSHVCCSR
ncbi:MAG: hypothetical protein WCP06_06905 [Verrucomicrobiota bacterium]